MNDQLEQLIKSFERSLRAKNRAKKTVVIYGGASRKLADWLREPVLPDGWDTEVEPVEEWADVTKQHLQAWMTRLLQDWSEGHASNQYRAVQQLFKWLAAEEEIDANPMLGMTPPTVHEKLAPVLELEEMRRLLKACEGRDFGSRRDTAILRMYVASGCRLSEIALLKVGDVDIDNRIATVTGKAGKQRGARFDPAAAVALDRYLRVRSRHEMSYRYELWLGTNNRQPMTPNGIYQMVVRRGGQVGLQLNPHKFRHTFSHMFLDAGGNESDLMEQNGWTSPAMVRRYGAGARANRARSAYDRINPMGSL